MQGTGRCRDELVLSLVLARVNKERSGERTLAHADALAVAPNQPVSRGQNAGLTVSGVVRETRPAAPSRGRVRLSCVPSERSTYAARTSTSLDRSHRTRGCARSNRQQADAGGQSGPGRQG